jgi:hypothetical protein
MIWRKDDGMIYMGFGLFVLRIPIGDRAGLQFVL